MVAYAVRRSPKHRYVVHDSTQHDRRCMYNITPGHIQCSFVALGVQHAKRMRHTVTCGPPGSTLLFHIISLTIWFSKKCFWTQNVCFGFPYNFCLKHFSF